ncbi:MAG: L-lysine 6-transaminase [Ignavibacteria bacterium]|nr:L-lysine 6-transaminase [Ignavibacteria bacterium]
MTTTTLETKQKVTTSGNGKTTHNPILPNDVIPTLQKRMLADGFDYIIDLEQSNGVWIRDARTGKNILDFFTCVASLPLGFNHPKLKEKSFLEKISRAAINKPSLSDIYTVEMAEFVDTFGKIAQPDYLPHVFFIDTGAHAVENALKASFDWKIRKNFRKGYREERGTQIIHFEKSFHGRSGYTLSLTNTDPVKTDLFPKFKWPRIINPSMKFPLNENTVQEIEKLEQRAIAQIKTAFQQNKDDIAAIIIEPIQGEGGDNHFRKEFFVAMRTLADENDAMLIFDEVQTGVGLTGKMWAHQYFVQPDMIAFGKKMQVCGFMCGKRIDEIDDNVFNVSSRLNSTWGGNLTDMVRAQKYLEVIEEDNLIQNTQIVGEYLMKRLNELQSEFPKKVSNARGRGLFCAFDLETGEMRNTVKNKCYADGLIILGSGDRSMRFRPALTIQPNEIDAGIEIIRKALKE